MADKPNNNTCVTLIAIKFFEKQFMQVRTSQWPNFGHCAMGERLQNRGMFTLRPFNWPKSHKIFGIFVSWFYGDINF